MFDRNLMKLDGMHAIMGALLVLALLQAASIIGQAHALSQAITCLWSGLPVGDAIPPLVAFFACFVILHLLRFGQETMLDRFSEKQALSLRDGILDAAFDARTLVARARGTAVVTTTVTEGIDEVQEYVRIIPPKVIGIAAISVPVLIGVLAIDWVSGIILAVMFPVIMFFMVLLGRQASARAERQYAAYTRLSNRFMDTLRGLDIIKAFDASDAEAKSVYTFSERLRRATIRTLTTATLSSAVLDLCATFGVAAVSIMLAFRLMDGSMLLAPALTALILAPEYFSPIRAFASDFHASLDGKNALAAVLDIIEDTKATAPDENEALESEQQISEWTAESTLRFEDVTYRYDESSGIGPVSFAAHGCERIAIVGKSGAGKSTLSGIVAGFLSPTAGTVYLNEKPVDLSNHPWKTQVRYIPQHPYVFHATLLDNVRFYAPDATVEAVERALDAVGLSGLVGELPDGLHTMIGAGARGLSGGQAHRIALARILVDPHARVLVFDEPAAHLDIETERDLKPAMLAAMEGRLVFFATHRLHWTNDLDRVIALEDGTVASDEIAAPPHAIPSGNATARDFLPADELRASDELASSAAGAPANQADASTDSASASGVDTRKNALPRWFSQFLARHKRSVAIAMLLGILASGCAALLMFTSGYLISATALPGITLFAIMVPVAFVQLFGLGRPLARYLERLVSHDWVLKATSELRLSLFRGIEQRIGDPARERAAGEYLAILADDIAHLQNLYLRVVFPTAIAVLLALGATILFGVFSIPFALATLLAFAILVVALPAATLHATRTSAHDAKDLRSRHFAHLSDDIMGSVDWALANRSNDVISVHAKADSAIRTTERGIRMTRRCMSLASSLLLGAAVCIVAVWAGNSFGTSGNTCWIAAFVLGFFPLIEAFSSLPTTFSQITVHEDAIGRLDEYIVSADDVPDTTRVDAISDEASAAAASSIEAFDATPAFPSSRPPAKSPERCDALDELGAPAICISGISYAYPQATSPTIRNVSLSIPAGQSVAVLGPSGAGKSTLAQLVRGTLKPQEGSVTVLGNPDNADSHAIDETAHSKSLSVGYLGQTPYLFNRTLRENLALGRKEASDELLKDVLASVGLGEKLDSLPDGLDTIVGETGTGFSGGESHRIALARVLVANTPIVLVDEPFSALDVETERDLLDTLIETCADKTLVVITHHLARIERFDRVVFLTNGHVSLDGSPVALKKSSPYFDQLLSFDRSAD